MSNIGSAPTDLNHQKGLIVQSSSGVRTDPMVELYADPLTHRLLVDSEVTLSDAQYKTMYDFDTNGTYIYIGEAVPNSAISAASWRIKKVSLDASGNPTSTIWANGTSSFDKIWNNHTSYTYTA